MSIEETILEPFQKAGEQGIDDFEMSFEDIQKQIQLNSIETDKIISQMIHDGKLEENSSLARWYKLRHDKIKKRVILPKGGRLISEFIEDISEELKSTNKLFYRPELRELVEIGRISSGKNNLEVYNGFIIVKPARFVSLLEQFVIPVKEAFDPRTFSHYEQEKSITSDLANIIINSEILHNALPRIDRIFSIPIPILDDGKLTFPRKGYDKRFNSWLSPGAPEISDPEMPLQEAREIINKIFGEFCFKSGKNGQDFTNAIAAFITPYLRGLMPSFSTRTPVFMYIGNRERCGKDYLAGCTGMLYEGYALEEAPISTGDNSSGSNEELRKKFLSALIEGRKRLHFANNKGHINNSVFEAITTVTKYSDRILGKSENITFDNEIDFSLSGNTGISFTPDLANRSRMIYLFFDQEDANARTFDNPDLHGWIMEHRSDILSALYSFVRNWFEKGAPEGSLPFASFRAWAGICGGVMEAAGYGNPCERDQETLIISGDNETSDMKALFELCYSKEPETWITKQRIREIVEMEDGPFNYMNFADKSDQTRFAFKINKFVGRVLSDIRMIVKDTTVRASRQEFKFTKEDLNRFLAT